LAPQRRAAERKLAKALRRAFASQAAALLKQIEAQRVPLLAAQQRARERTTLKELPIKIDLDWGAETARMTAELGNLIDGILAQASGEVEKRYRHIRVRLTWDLWDAAAQQRAQVYKYDLIKDINDVTRDQLGKTVGAWIESDEGLPALAERVRKLVPPKSALGTRDRATLIAQTETTRVYADTRLAGMKAAGLRQMCWRTANDDIVCPICQALGMANGGEGAIGDVASGMFLNALDGKKYSCPAHPGCRCWIVENVTELEALTAFDAGTPFDIGT